MSLRPRVADSDRRSVGSVGGQKRVQTRLRHRSSPDFRTARLHPSDPSVLAGYGRRNSRSTVKRGHSSRKSDRRRSRLLQPLLSGSKKVGGVATDSQSKTVKPVPSHRIVFHGNDTIHPGSSTTRRLDGFHRPQGRVFSHRDPRGFSEVPPIYDKRCRVRVHRSPVRSRLRSSPVYKGRAGAHRVHSPPICPDSPVPRRLAIAEPEQNRTRETPCRSLVDSPSSRLHSEPGEIFSHSLPRHDICRDEIDHSHGDSLSYAGSSRQAFNGTQLYPASTIYSSQASIGNYWHDGIYVGHSPLGSPAPQAYPNLLVGPLATIPAAHYSRDSCSTSSPCTPMVVVRYGEPAERGPVADPIAHSRSFHGCLHDRLGSASGRTDNIGQLVGGPTEATHQLVRTPSGVSRSPMFSAENQQPARPSQYGQCHGGCLYQQEGGDQISDVVLPYMGPLHVVHKTQCVPSSSSFTGQTQSHSRCSLSGQKSVSDGVGDPPGNCGSDLCNLGNSHGRPVCDIPEPQTASVCVASPRSQSTGSRRTIHVMEEPTMVRVPSTSTAPTGPSENSSGRDHSDSSSSGLAQEVLVPGSTGSVGRSPSSVASETGPSLSGSPPGPSGPGRLQPSRVQVVEQSLIENGFSRTAAATIARPQRASTLSTYEDKWSKFCDWCHKQSINPLKISVNQLAEFFLFLHKEKEFSPSTLAVYRTAIASTIKSTGGPDFSHNAALSAMLRNFKIERPPTRRLVPQWSLSLVLKGLQQSPFEPLSSVSLKALTYKTVFLIALASGSRRSEIHALGSSKELLSISKTEAVLRTRPGFLAKNQVLGTVTRPFTIKALDALTGPDPQERLLCPVRCLRWYLRRTESFRAGRVRLFLPIPPSASRDISKATISAWITRTVRWVYNESSETDLRLTRVTAHEVRALSASLVYAAGTPAEDVLRAGTWRCPNSFVSFYLRDLASESEGLFSLGPISAGQQVVQGNIL